MIETVYAFIRGIIYLWVCFESLLGAYVYMIGYSNRKTKERAWNSPIIIALMILMLSIALMSAYLFVVSMFRIFRPESYFDITFWGPVFYVPIGLSLDKFRCESMDDGIELKKGKVT
jgi:nitrate reductase NapE component